MEDTYDIVNHGRYIQHRVDYPVTAVTTTANDSESCDSGSIVTSQTEHTASLQ